MTLDLLDCCLKRSTPRIHLRRKSGSEKAHLSKTSKFNTLKTTGQKVSPTIHNFRTDSTAMDPLYRKLTTCTVSMEKPKKIAAVCIRCSSMSKKRDSNS